MDNAECRTKKSVTEEYSHSNFSTERNEDKHGNYWVVKVRNLFFTDYYVPMKEDSDTYLTKKQKEKYKCYH